MSSEQATLSDVARQAESPGTDEPAPGWAPTGGDESATQCLSCGGYVSPRFARVFGDEQNRVHACQTCANGAILRDGGAADPDHEWRHD